MNPFSVDDLTVLRTELCADLKGIEPHRWRRSLSVHQLRRSRALQARLDVVDRQLRTVLTLREVERVTYDSDHDLRSALAELVAAIDGAERVEGAWGTQAVTEWHFDDEVNVARQLLIDTQVRVPEAESMYANARPAWLAKVLADVAIDALPWQVDQLTAVDESVPRDGYDYPTTDEVMRGGQQRGRGFDLQRWTDEEAAKDVRSP